MDLLGWIIILWQWFTAHCNASKQQYYICICLEAWTQKTTCPILQTACADKGNVCREVEGSLTLAANSTAGEDGARQTEKGEDEKVTASEDEQRERLGSLVRCGEVVLGQQEKGEAPGGRGNTQLNLIHFRAVNLHFPRGNLWLCNLGNSVFAALSTEPPEHHIIVKEDQDLQQLTTTLHFPWQWIKSSQRNKKLWLKEDVYNPLQDLSLKRTLTYSVTTESITELK